MEETGKGEGYEGKDGFFGKIWMEVDYVKVQEFSRRNKDDGIGDAFE